MKASRITIALLATTAAHFAFADGVEHWQVPETPSSISRADVRAQAIEAARSEAAQGRGDSAEAIRASRQSAPQAPRARTEVTQEAREAVRTVVGTFVRDTAAN